MLTGQFWKGDWEMIDGVPFAMSPSPNKVHQRISRKTCILLDSCIKTIDCNCEIFYELDWRVNEATVFCPDVMILCNDNDPNFPSRTPVLIVEIISQSPVSHDKLIKYNEYAKYGVPNYIIIDPKIESISIYTLSKGYYNEQAIHDPISIDNCEISPEWNRIFG